MLHNILNFPFTFIHKNLVFSNKKIEIKIKNGEIAY
jgi:hypothetical protein